MRVLLVKTSSLGDLIHTFPALSDAAAALPGIRFDWLVEENFAEVPAWHPAVEQAIPIGLRRWRRGWRKAMASGEIRDLRRRLRAQGYDHVIDAQGLLKSAIPARWARAPVAGYDRRSAREPLASTFYSRRFAVPRQQHAIARIRQLFAQALDYPLAGGEVDYGLRFAHLHDASERRLVFLHGTTWPSKHWPEPFWAELVHLASEAGYAVDLPWGDPDDRLRAERIISAAGGGRLLPHLSLTELARTLAGAQGVVGVDSGLAHLAAAVDTPAVTLYGPTRTDLTGALGPRQKNLAAEFECAPCMQRICSYTAATPVRPACFMSLDPRRVFTELEAQIRDGAG
ncbi:MAG: lipopolysaccharide heptosyltransferase I [Gammaproteobacteria bacterium]|nr:lipopolysaccharide heptosyltransferase I [Gammaproteobacteria bacterium]